MRKLFIESTGGCKTPDDIAKSLKKYGTLIAVKPDPYLNGQRKYYTIETFGDSRVVEVLIIDNKAVYTKYLPPECKKVLQRQQVDVLADQIQYGNF